MGLWVLRMRSLVYRQFRLVVAVLLCLALFGGWLAVGTQAPETTTERPVSSWSTTGEYDHSATVTEPNPVYPVGRELTNRSLYLRAASPVLDGSFRFVYDASSRGELDVTIEQQAVVRSVDEQRGESVTVWRRSQSLENRTVDDVAPGSPVVVPFSVNVTEVRNRTRGVEQALGNPPGDPQYAVVADVTLTGTVNGREIERTTAFTLPISVERSAYRPNATTAIEQFETTEEVTLAGQSSGFESGVGLALVLGSVLGLTGLAYKRDALAVTERELDRLRFEDDRETFDEWIHGMTLPDGVRERQRIYANSLADLVDFAIDTNNSVIRDGDYYVLHGDVLYTYVPPGRAESAPVSDVIDALSEADSRVSGDRTDDSHN